jgi:hypothetical protein
MIKLRMMQRVGYVACMEEMRRTYTILVEKPERKKLFVKSRRRWKDNIKVNLG